MRLSDTLHFDIQNKTTLVRLLIMITVIVGILLGSLMILSPFIPAIILAIIFCLSTWPAFVWLEKKLGHKTHTAAMLMTIMLAIGFVVPLILIANSLTGNFSKLYTTLITTMQNSDGKPPAWVSELPFVSDYATAFWAKYLSDTQTLSHALNSHAGVISQRLLAAGAIIGRGVVDLSLGVFITYFLFRNGVQVAERLSAFIEKFIGEYGQHVLTVSKNTMISVLYGIVGTAVLQGTLAAIGFTIAQVPGGVFLGLLTFFFSFIPFGTPIVWIPAVVWLFSESHIGMGIFLTFWGAVVIGMTDNVIRAYFISLGTDLPLLLVLLGVLGGIMAFGFIGLFIGPTLLAVAYTLIIAWTNKQAVTGDETAAKPEIYIE